MYFINVVLPPVKPKMAIWEAQVGPHQDDTCKVDEFTLKKPAGISNKL